MLRLAYSNDTDRVTLKDQFTLVPIITDTSNYLIRCAHARSNKIYN